MHQFATILYCTVCFNFDPWILTVFHSVSKCRDSGNNIPCRNLLINVIKIIIDFVIIIVIIIKITTI